MNLNLPPIISQIASIVTQLVGYGLLVLIAAAVIGRFGVRVPYLPSGNITELTWLAGAWWLYRGGKL